MESMVESLGEESRSFVAFIVNSPVAALACLYLRKAQMRTVNAAKATGNLLRMILKFGNGAFRRSGWTKRKPK
jgi:hypothetical protein